MNVPWDEFLSVVSQLNADASPGYPWGLKFVSKGVLVEKDALSVYESVCERINLYLKPLPVCEDHLRSIMLVESGMCDPVRIFVKNEPHAVDKVATGRLRLVMSVSVIDEICERLLFSVQNGAEIAECYTCPARPGIGLSTDLQTKTLYKDVEPHIRGGRGKKSDVSGWDWSFKGWMYDADLKFRTMLNHGWGTIWHRLATRRFECLKWSLFATSHGRMYAQMKPGIMLSGSYLTSSTNSHGRLILADVCKADWATALGDDCCEETPLSVEDLKAEYHMRGFLVRDVSVCPRDSFTFCSHVVTRDKAIPLNFLKGAFRLLSKERCSMLDYAQFMSEYRHLPNQCVAMHNFLLTLPDWCREIKDNEDC